MMGSRILVPIIGSALMVGSASGQVNLERFAKSDFNFTSPGARSAALGGAFVGIADDATAVEANPAGLTILLYPEASFELKWVRSTATVEERAGGGIDGRAFARQTVFPSFVSGVLPWGKFRFAVSYAKIVDAGGELAANGADLDTEGHLLPWHSNMDWNVENLGFAAAVKLSTAFSVGAAGGISRMRLAIDDARYWVNNPTPGYLWERVTVTESEGKRNAPFANLGAIARSGRFSAGVTYKIRPKFQDIPVSTTGVNGERHSGLDQQFVIKLPDAIGGGVGLRATDRLTLSVAAEQVLYSQLADPIGIVTGSQPFTRGSTEPPSSYRADDGVDYRAGLEWVAVAGSIPVALRAGGASLAPANVYYTGGSEEYRALWGTAPGLRRTEISAGIGARIARVLQVDAAAVISDDRKAVTTSFVYVREPGGR